MTRHSFIQMSKLSNVKGRISYITSHARQENLYAAYRKAEAVVENYNRELAEWERKVNESRRPAEKERYEPPEKQSVRDQLRRLQAEGKQKPKHRSHDRER